MAIKEDNNQAEETLPRGTRTPKRRSISVSTFLLSLILVMSVGFVLGTRSDQLYAAIAPVFGIRASADTIDTSLLQKVYRELKANFDGDLDSDKLIDGAARGMTAAAGDQYTVFMDAKEAEEFRKELSGQISGIGCEIGVRSDQPTVLRVIAGSPAERAGLKAGDVFVSVNDDSVEGKTSSEVASKVRGDAGTSVKLTMSRNGELVEFTITREQVSDPSVRWAAVDGVGVLTISRFDEDAADLARRGANELIAQGVTSVVVDLRNNGGGYLQSAQEIAGLWLDKKLVVTEKSGGKVVDQIYSQGSPVLKDVKTVVLVNDNSASASEILAGALQEYNVAKLVGQKTFGKGTVQQVLDLPDGRLLKVTIARWYTPKGKNITKEGISPDVKVDLTLEDINAGRDPQLDKAKELVR
ncbi:MAG: S41 family peptidase [Candidatus Saccharimonas sp.]